MTLFAQKSLRFDLDLVLLVLLKLFQLLTRWQTFTRQSAASAHCERSCAHSSINTNGSIVITRMNYHALLFSNGVRANRFTG